MDDIQVIDNFLSKEEQDLLEETTTSYGFPWHYGPSNVYTNEDSDNQSFLDNNTIDSYQFTHVFYHSHFNYFSREHQELVQPFINKCLNFLGDVGLLRLKANLLTNNKRFSEGHYNPSHVDDDKTHLVVVYYVNDADGDTVIFNETFGENFDKLTVKRRVQPKKGRAVIFPGKFFHASCNPVNNDVRVILNANFKLSVKTVL
jgi:hypothetical protein